MDAASHTRGGAARVLESPQLGRTAPSARSRGCPLGAFEVLAPPKFSKQTWEGPLETFRPSQGSSMRRGETEAHGGAAPGIPVIRPWREE